MTRTVLNGLERIPKSRFASRPVSGQSVAILPLDDEAVVSRRTKYPLRVQAAGEGNGWLLKSASHNAKIGGTVRKGKWKGNIGGVIRKGKWKGMPIYTLTLEERATCPRTCQQWQSCYGNSIPLARRAAAGPALEARLSDEIKALDIRHLNGFVVRLHVLGDFYSVEYVELWRRMLRQYSTLRIFGYTARIDAQNDPIAAALASVADEFGWDRFAVRLSGAPTESRSTAVVERPYQKPRDAIQCPEQVGRVATCSACGLCWQSEKRIAFIQH